MTSLAGCTASNKPNWDEPLVIKNRMTDPQTVRVEIKHVDSGEIVYNNTHTVNTKVEIFNFKELKDQYSGVEEFEIFAETEKDSDSEGYKTNACHGQPEITISEDNIYITHIIC